MSSAVSQPINGLRELIAYFDQIRSGRPPGCFVFRGQRAGWKLKTSLELACERIDSDAVNPLAHALKHERYFLREFRRRAHHYLSDLPGPGQLIEWLALMRHHGAPTRLLDATYSIYVAAYFAIQHSEREKDADAALWIFDSELCKTTAVAALTNVRGGGNTLAEEIDLDNEDRVATALLSEPQTLYVCPINPFRLNERLTIQRGVFLAPGDVARSFDENLTTLAVTVVIIPRGSFGALTADLHGMNISEATLFPGLDGFARSLLTARQFHRHQRPDLD